MIPLHLELLGQRIRVEGAEDWVRDGVLAAAPLLARPGASGPPDLVYEFRALSRSESLPSLASYRREAVSAASDFEFRRKGDERWLLVEGRSASRFVLDEGTVRAFVHPDHARDPWIVGHRLFFLPLLEWMRFRGFYPLHGSCFLAGGRGVIVSGPSGSGKSTATLAAIAAGCPFVADDTLFAFRRGGVVRVASFPEPIKVGRKSAAAFPELRASLRLIGGKYVLPEESLPAPGRVAEAVPAVLLFPEVADRDASLFEPLSGEEAMVRLLPQSVLPADRKRIESHMGALAELVGQTSAYRLLFGRDFRDLPSAAAKLPAPGPRPPGEDGV